jgi:hypothetical protein
MAEIKHCGRTLAWGKQRKLPGGGGSSKKPKADLHKSQ